MMLTPRTKIAVDMAHAADVLKDISNKTTEMLVQFDWKGVQITLYRSGSMHFYHFIDVPLGKRYAEEILAHVRG
ncbi:hypothetical protein [Methanomassiliicoccus luminyensis]|jgi:hypothetical protein|uniref:hypothetical protein n=1 Tax=Methanomassiliicoccus luminyensis TaxID=1080712 RepID=UPI0004744A0E|nr:hypothetical protein [Methanomassiliicoccus luminyensis]